MSDNVAIKVEGVNKTFKLPHEKATSVKHLFVNFFRPSSGYEKQQVLKDISFEIKKGEFFGIVGRNGSGKSTLLKLLAGVYTPDSGLIQTSGKLVPFIELGVGFNPELTGRENVYLNGALLGFSEVEVDGFYDQVVEFAELERFMDQKLKNYSSGMQVRLAFSMAVRAEADILLIDEVLAVGDADFQRKCFEYFRTLKRNNKTVVFVSHDMGAVEQYCDRAVLIEKSKIVMGDTAHKVAKSYTKMFIAESNHKKNTDIKKSTNRSGSKKMVFKNAEVSLQGKDSEEIEINMTLKANQEIERPKIGFVIKNFAGLSLAGTNTDLKRKYIDNVKKDQEIKVSWNLANILNEGEYSIDISVSSNGEVSDWWEDALSLNILKDNKTPYIVNPDVVCRIKQDLS